MPMITSNPNNVGDPTTVAAANVPLLNRDEHGNEVDWRAKWPCSCPPRLPADPEPSLTDLCLNCQQMHQFLDRIRRDRRLNESAPRAGGGIKGPRGRTTPREPREEETY